MSAKSVRKIKQRLIAFISVICLLSAFLESGMIYIHKKGAWQPDYDKKDIAGILNENNLNAQDYDIIFSQTGLSKTAVDALLSRNEADKILEIQKAYFSEYNVEHEIFAPFTCSDRMNISVPLGDLQDGDIIVSPSSHVSYLKSGHAAIVVNADEGRVLNATGYGYPSSVEDITELNCRPSFVVLRLKADKEVRSEIAKYALENLCNIKYSLFAGIFNKYKDGNVTATHCGHLVWYAFNHFGFNIDSNEGLIAWPSDIASSNLLETVQIYGVNPDNYWK